MIFHSEPIAEITLPIKLKSQNLGRGWSWYATQKLRLEYELALTAEYTRDPLPFPVCVMYTRILGKREVVWDNDNLALALKQLQDTLTALGWWKDDSDEWLRVIAYRHDGSRRTEGPAVLVSIWRLEE